MDIMSIIIIKLHRGWFYTFLLDKSNMMEISYGLLLWRYLFGDPLWGSYSDMTWGIDILEFGYLKMTWDIVSDMMGTRLEI